VSAVSSLWWIISGAVAAAILPWLISAIWSRRVGISVGFAIAAFAGLKLFWQIVEWSEMCGNSGANSEYCASSVIFVGPPPATYAVFIACLVSLFSTLSLLFETKRSRQRSGVLT
jgi:hypothetical protein